MAEFAHMNINWKKIVEDIHKGILSANIINAREEDSSDEDQANNIEENFNLQKILDLNQVTIK